METSMRCVKYLLFVFNLLFTVSIFNSNITSHYLKEQKNIFLKIFFYILNLNQTYLMNTKELFRISYAHAQIKIKVLFYFEKKYIYLKITVF